MNTISCDFHKQTSNFTVIDSFGKIDREIKMKNIREDLIHFVRSLPGPKELTLEASRNWPLLYEILKDEVDQVHLAHPKKTRMIAESEIKNDRLDAAILARLTRAGFLPKAYICPEEVRYLRNLLRFRCKLVWKRTTLKNEIHILIDRHLFPAEKPFGTKSLFSQKGLRWLEEVVLPVQERFILDQLLDQFREIEFHLAEVQRFIREQALPNSQDSLYLRTVPGMGGKVAHFVVLAEIATIHRFPSADALIHYAGLIPRERSSGEKRYRGGLIKERNTFLRQILLEATVGAVRRDKGLRDYYNQVKKRAGASAARVATARKLTRFIYSVLKEQRAYRPFNSNTSAAALKASL